ncbi:LPXTG cell wall anchor domain-containing protein, partial [Streptococcus equi]|uniref:LPXTG cell wall anchor domain-containing protein n=1 Tax=Streptococcus equi TaxID=1336 RepID=UPI00055D6706
PEEPKKPEKPKTPEHKTEEPDKKTLPKTGINPKTGDFFNYSLYAGLLALSGGSLLLLSRKYKKEEE